MFALFFCTGLQDKDISENGELIFRVILSIPKLSGHFINL
jgi:hypothetical protein